MPAIFISHSSKDKDFACRLADDLQQLGHTPWLDEWEIRVGECIPSRIEEGLKGAHYVIVVLSPESVSSGWVDREWKARYFDEVEKKSVVILPALYKECEVPLLLKSRKYADFRSNYAIGLALLAAALVPRPVEQLLAVPIPLAPSPSPVDKEIEALLQKLQRPASSVAECMSETLPIARKVGAQELEEFCRFELSGYAGRDKRTTPPRHRLIEVFCSTSARINPMFIGWNGSSSTVLDHLERDEHFTKMQYVWSSSVSVLEARAQEIDKSGRSMLLTWTVPYGDLSSKTKRNIPPETPVIFYARPDTNQMVLEAVRRELTTRLLELLPSTSVKS